MGNAIYGKPRNPVPPALITAAPSLQDQMGILEKRKVHLEKLIEINTQKARDSKTKDESLRFIKLKVMYANELKSLFGMLDKLEGLDNARQRLHFQKDVLAVTAQATSVIKQNTIDADKADDIMDNAREAIDDVAVVTDILSRTDPPSREIQEELDALFEEKKPVPVEQPVIVQFPQVPQQNPTPMEKELRMLVTE